MHFVYGLANGHAFEARRVYAERYPQREIPDARTFTNIHQRLHETGRVEKSYSEAGRTMSIRTAELEEAVLNEVDEHPETSTRKIAAAMNVSHQTVLRILKDQLLYPYHIQRVQALLPGDFPQRVAFCNWIRQKIAEVPQFTGT